MEVNYEQELQTIERCLNDFNFNLGALMRKSSALLDYDVAAVFGAAQIDLTNLALAAGSLATKCAMLRHRMYKTAAWNEAYKAAYGTNHPVWEASHYDDPHER